MRTEIRVQRWARAAAGFLFVAAFLGLAVAGGHPAASTEPARSISGWVPSGMHEAQSGADVGPGSDEALLVSSPMPE
ncbi:MAG TPA: hypothetical protein VFD38_13265 [Myxococcaceae bacterium]|nr:hypothetical protein [Myxococcaceae bacterium]